MDAHPRRRHDDHRVRHRHAARRLRRLAARHEGRRHGDGRRDVLRRVPAVLARAAAALRVRVQAELVRDQGRLQRRADPELEPVVPERRGAAQRAARPDPGGDDAVRLGVRHAQQHDQHAGRGLRDLRRGQRPAAAHDRAEVRRAQRAAAQRHRVRAVARRGARRIGAGRGRLQLPRPGPPALRSGDQPRLPADAGAVPGAHREHADRDLHRRPALRPTRSEGADA